MDTPKVSVLLPVYNTQEKHLKEAIDSILSQTYYDFEVIVVNDCSSDQRVEEIALSYSDPRIRYYKNEKNEGISLTRNKLIGLAKGDYLAVMDHDDIAMPSRLKEQAEYLDSHPDVGVVGSWYERFSKDKSEVQKGEAGDLEIKLSLMYDCTLLHPSSMIRKELFESVKYESEFSPAEDYALWCRLIPKTKFHIIPKVLVKYRDHDTNTSKVRKGEMKQARAAVLHFVRDENLQLWNAARNNMDCVVRVKLFGVLQVAKFKHKGSIVPGFWHYMPFISLHVKLDEN